MKFLAIVATILASVSCEGGAGPAPRGESFGPSDTLAVSITPQTLPVLSSAALTCSRGPALTTTFDLVIVPSTRFASTLDSVTIRMIDGTHLGGPMVTFPRPELGRMFGSTALVGSRAFRFQPSFGC